MAGIQGLVGLTLLETHYKVGCFHPHTKHAWCPHSNPAEASPRFTVHIMSLSPILFSSQTLTLAQQQFIVSEIVYYPFWKPLAGIPPSKASTPWFSRLRSHFLFRRSPPRGRRTLRGRRLNFNFSRRFFQQGRSPTAQF